MIFAKWKVSFALPNSLVMLNHYHVKLFIDPVTMLPRVKDLWWRGMLIQTLMRLAACDFCVWIGFDNDGNLELLSWLGILWLPRFPPSPCLSVWCVPDPRHQFWQSLTRILTRNFHFNWPWCLLTAVHWSQTRGVDMWSVHTFSNDYFANSHK